ncbi:MAG: DUF1634 domain-containing protein [Thermoanaerobaculia bacterium]
MTRRDDDTEPQWVEGVISNLLRVGVLTSIAVVLVGVTFTFVHHPDYFSSRPDLGRLIDSRLNYTNSISMVIRGVGEMRGQAIVMLGILLLIATPVMRVAVSIVVFLIEKDLLYVAITATVLTLLIVSFFLGAGGG